MQTCKPTCNKKRLETWILYFYFSFVWKLLYDVLFSGFIHTKPRETFIFHEVFIGNWIRYDPGKSFLKEDPVYKDSYIKLLGNVFLNIAQQKRNELNDK